MTRDTELARLATTLRRGSARRRSSMRSVPAVRTNAFGLMAETFFKCVTDGRNEMICLHANGVNGLVPLAPSLFASAAKVRGSYFKPIVCGLLKYGRFPK